MKPNEWDEMQMAAVQASDLLAELDYHGITAYIEGSHLRMSPSLYDRLSDSEAGDIEDNINTSRASLEVVLIAEQIACDGYVS